MNWDGRIVSERRTAGALILSKLRLAERAGKKGEIPLGSIGGFELRCDVGRGYFRETRSEPGAAPLGLRPGNPDRSRPDTRPD